MKGLCRFAAEAGAEAGALGGWSVGEKNDVAAEGAASGANGAAVDTGSADPGAEYRVEGGVVRFNRPPPEIRFR